MMPKVKRTYGSRPNKQSFPSSPSSSLSSSPLPSTKRKRPLEEHLSIKNIPPPPKRAKSSEKPKQQKPQQKTLTQLHFCLDTSILRTCPLCNLTYTKAAPDDENLHRAHCARVQRGMEWGREEEREKLKTEVIEVASGVRLKDGRKGRVICFKADVGGKIGSKLTTLLETINLALSSPALTTSILQASKAYLFLLPPTSPTSSREKIVGCVIAQRITTAMAIASPAERIATGQIREAGSSPSTSFFAPHEHNSVSPLHSSAPTPALIAVDTSTGLFCQPTPLPTPLGIPRLFVSSSHRRQGIASQLLSAAAATFVHGCPLDPRKGEVAFTQPTGAGGAVMQRWGMGGVRIYEE